MRQISLQQIPNQSLTIQLDDLSFDMRFHTCNSGLAQIMAVSLVINEIVVLSGQRLVAGYPIIPYVYLEQGNFVLVTMNDEYPNWEFFGITQNLVYVSSLELSTLRTPAVIINASA